MIEIKGKYTNAIVYEVSEENDNFDTYAKAQIQMICDNPSSEGSTIRVMPDVHPGKVGPIGLTMTVGKGIMPSIVGVDIGCGMTIAKIGCKNVEFQKLDSVIRENVPVGAKIRRKNHSMAEDVSLDELACYDKIDDEKALHSVGTLGGGNHFIELDKDDEGNTYLIVHSGSRHLGTEVTEYYLKKGQTKDIPYEMTVLVDTLKDEYVHDLQVVQKFAEINRNAIIDSIVRGMKWKISDMYTCIHNYVGFDKELNGAPIIRKGSIYAGEGEKVIIPINMKDGVILGTGLGNKEWNYSAPHGAGRKYKRSEVAERFTVSEFKKSMKGIYSICINKNTLDEAPFVYRDKESIIDTIKETVRIDKLLKPVYNYKA